MKETKEKNISTNRIFLPILFILSSIILDIVNFLYLGLKNSNGQIMAIPTYFLFDLAIIFMLAGLIYIMQNKIAMMVGFWILLLFQVVIGVVNTTMYNLFGDILSVDLLKLGAEATTAFSADLIDWGGAIMNVVLYLAFGGASLCLYFFNKSTYKVKHFSPAVLAIAFFILIESFSTCLFELQTYSLSVQNESKYEIEDSDEYLWENFQFKMDSYKKFGYFGFYTREIYKAIFKEKITEEETIAYRKYINDGIVYGNENAKLYNDNLIVILLESIDLYGIDPIYTPTLWKMWNGEQSASFRNFHARNRTNNSEGITLLGSMPKSVSIKNAYDNGYKFEFSLPHLFKEGGSDDVVTTYVHPNYEAFYDRSITHKLDGIGFDNLVTLEDYEGMKIDYWGEWFTDEGFVRNVIDDMLPTNERFLTYFSTMSTHGPHTFEKKAFKEHYEYYDNHFEEFKSWALTQEDFLMPTDEDTLYKLRNFKVGTIDLDRTISYLLEEIDNRGLTDNTSILLFADHNLYYHDMCYKMKGIEKSEFSSIEVNHIPAMLYSPKLYKSGGELIDESCSTYDLLPTLCDLYGLASNKNLFLGNSIFSDEISNSIFVSHLGGIFTDKIYSQNISDLYIKSDNVSEEDINSFKENANNFYKKQEIIDIICTNGINS